MPAIGRFYMRGRQADVAFAQRGLFELGEAKGLIWKRQSKRVISSFSPSISILTSVLVRKAEIDAKIAAQKKKS